MTRENIATAKRNGKGKSARTVAEVSYLQDLQQQAERYLGTTIEPSEWDKAKADAERKLKNIINREGDGTGERRKTYYLAQLIAEAVRSDRFSKFSVELIGFLQFADEQMGIKKGQPVS